MKKLRTTSRAEEDIRQCAVWLEHQQPGLGGDFLDMVDEALDEIVQRPNSCPTLVLAGVCLKLQLRWLGLARFPHVVIFHDAAEEVCIYGVVHPRQDLESILVQRLGAQYRQDMRSTGQHAVWASEGQWVRLALLPAPNTNSTGLPRDAKFVVLAAGGRRLNVGAFDVAGHRLGDVA